MQLFLKDVSGINKMLFPLPMLFPEHFMLFRRKALVLGIKIRDYVSNQAKKISAASSYQRKFQSGR